jgi:hypothetical protein
MTKIPSILASTRIEPLTARALAKSLKIAFLGH